jgi:hypothetical protein
MNEQELNAIMQHDLKLWDSAVVELDKSGVMSRTLDLPHGIGPYTIIVGKYNDFNAMQRRDAVGQFGEAVRAAIKDRIDDEAVTARAQQAAARAMPPADPVPPLNRSNTGRSGEVPAEAPVPSFEEAVFTREGVTRQLHARRQRFAELNQQLITLEKEIKALTAMEAILNADAPEDSSET